MNMESNLKWYDKQTTKQTNLEVIHINFEQMLQTALLFFFSVVATAAAATQQISFS